MLSTKLKEAAGNSADATLYVNDVFSTYLYTGNGSTQTITNGIDLAGKGGMVWIKDRTADASIQSHYLMDTNRGTSAGYVSSNSTNAANPYPLVNSFNSNGFGFNPPVSDAGYNWVSWTFRKAAKFFDVQTVTHVNGTADNINLSVLSTVGMVIAKITSATGDWTVWQRSLTAGNNLKLNLDNVQSTTDAWLSVSGTTATLSASAPTGTYIIYAYAHDTSSTGVIQCGSFTTDAGGGASVTLNWEPQYLLVKTFTPTSDVWRIVDTMRGMPVSGGTPELYAEYASAESVNVNGTFRPNAAGFTVNPGNIPSSNSFIYMAIRMPNKPPTTGTQVYNVFTSTSTETTSTPATSNITDDLFLNVARDGGYCVPFDRLRGAGIRLFTQATDAEQVTSTGAAFDVQTGIRWLGSYSNVPVNKVNYHFKRAPGFFDEVCYTGDGNQTTNRPHNLSVAPELMITKRRNGVGNWYVVYATSPTIGRRLYLNDASASNTWGATYFTSTTYYAGIDSNNATCVSYLFATLAGISKVGSYTGNGTGQAIACGFSAGARFVLIKRTDSTGDWYTFDSARGLTSGSSPYLLLNSTAAEVTGNNGVYASTGGFTLGATAITTTNIVGASYIFLAVS